MAEPTRVDPITLEIIRGSLASTIREVELNAMEDRALTAFTLALDQARLAITDRRNMLVKVAA